MKVHANVAVREKLFTFFHRYPALHFEKKQMVIHGAEVPKGIHYLVSGNVRQYNISRRTGNEFTVHIYNAGSYFPLAWALNDTPNRHFFQTIGPCEIRLAPKEDVVAFLHDDAELLLSLSKRLFAGIDGLTSRLEYQVFGDSYTKVIVELIYLAKHFGTKEDGIILLEEQFTHQNLADLTGMVRETISVAMEKLSADNYIRYQGNKIVIEDIDSLIQKRDLLI